MKIGCSEVPKQTYPSLLLPAEWKEPAPLWNINNGQIHKWKACSDPSKSLAPNSFYEEGVTFCLGLLGLRTSSFLLNSKTWPWKINKCKKWSKVLFLTMSHSCPRRRWWQERGRRRSQHRSSDGIEALWKLKEKSGAVYEQSKISKIHNSYNNLYYK